MICLDNDVAVIAFQKDPKPEVAVLRARIRAFLKEQNTRIMFPAVTLAEYLWRADAAELEVAIRKAVGELMFSPSFDTNTARVAAKIGRQYSAGRKMSDVARECGVDRVALKADLLLVATAVHYQAAIFLTNDSGCHRVAKFADLDSRLVRELPDPPPPVIAAPPPAPPRQLPGTVRGSLFPNDVDPGEPSI